MKSYTKDRLFQFNCETLYSYGFPNNFHRNEENSVFLKRNKVIVKNSSFFLLSEVDSFLSSTTFCCFLIKSFPIQPNRNYNKIG